MTAATVRASGTGPATGLIAPVLLLAVLAATVGLGEAGWSVGVAVRADHRGGAGSRPRARSDDRLGPASWVTLARATLAVGVAALRGRLHDTPVALLVTLAAVALALDAADGWVARRTGTATALGARFDGEVDAFLILALSVYVAPIYGAWVLAIGAARYLFLAGEWLLPWMRAPLPRRRWRRVVAAAQGVVLTVAAAGRPPASAHAGAPGRRARRARGVGRRVHVVAVAPPDAVPERDVRPPAAALTVLALLLVWAALVAPNQPADLTLGAFARLPLELLVVVAVAALLPATPRRVLAVVVGALLSAARAREGPRHRVLHGVQPAVQAGRRLELRGDRHRDAARRGGQLERGPRRRRRGRAHPRDPHPPGPGAAARDAGGGRPPRLGAAGGGGIERGLAGPAESPARRSPPRARPPWPSTRCRRCGRGWRIARRSRG